MRDLNALRDKTMREREENRGRIAQVQEGDVAIESNTMPYLGAHATTLWMVMEKIWGMPLMVDQFLEDNGFEPMKTKGRLQKGSMLI